MTAQISGTGEVYHESPAPRYLKHKELGGRKRLYSDLAYCRMRLGRLRHSPKWAEFYREDCARLRRLLDVRNEPRSGQGDLTRQCHLWLRLSESRPLPVVEGKGIGPDKKCPEPIDTHCPRCESWGHEVTSCPFDAGDQLTLRVAEQRRERRMREAATILSAVPVVDERFASLYR